MPEPHPPWLDLCPIEHESGSVIDFPVVQDLLSLLWIVNLGCIDLNQRYARCDDVNRPDYVHFDLDPVTGEAAVPFEHLRDAPLMVRDALTTLHMPAYVKTTGSRGFHVYVPIVRGPTQKEVWEFAKRVALALVRVVTRDGASWGDPDRNLRLALRALARCLRSTASGRSPISLPRACQSPRLRDHR